MDSPKSCKSTTTTATETAPVQDSPVFSYISNLSPIQPVKAPSVTPGFPGLNSPPLVFTSPRLNPHSQTTFLKRAARNLSGQSEGCMKSVPGVNASVSLDVQLNTTLNSCNEKGSHGHSSLDDQIGSPTGCSDQFLADVVNMDSVDPNVSSDSSVQKSEVIEQPLDAVTDSEEIKEKQEYEHNKMINEEVAVTPPAGEIQGVHKEDLSINVSEVEDDRKLGDSISIDCQIIESQLPVDDALKTQDEDCTTENAIAELAGSLDQSNQLLSESLQIERKDDSSVEATGAVSAEPVLKKERSDVEAFQHRGVRRRCLQFEDALQKVITNQQAQNPPEIRPLRLETPLTPINMERGDVIQPMHPRNTNSTIRTPKPSGIGLHLNSIVNSVQTGSGAIVHVKSAQRGNFSIRGKNSKSSINSRHCDSSNSSSVFSLAENITASTEENRHESNASLAAASSATSLSTFVVKPANSPLILNSLEDQSTPDNNRKCSNTEADGVSEEFKSSPKRKRKKYSNSSDGDGCKRCNCKKSRCLKLYCDCFAAGIYCAEPCSCQGCYNRPEFEETVLETRQQIESRNPLAFAPKVVQHLIDPPTSSYGEDGARFTPSSARHKRGCNCKKSMCLKKYCECYQANVGCSDGCRCEGCKNIYGQKGEYGMIKDVLSEEGTNERTDGSLIEKMVASGTEMYHHELSNPHNLTPLTPAIQFSNHRKDASKAWRHSGEYFLSPETDLPFIAPYMISPGSPRNSDNNRTISGTAQEILDLVSSDQELYNNRTISETAQEILDLVSSDQELYYGNPETVDDFSISYHQPGNQQEWANISKPHSISGNKHYSSLSSSLRWRGSPNTPMVQFCGTKPPKVIELDDELSNVIQDDTPDILKENPTPLNVVKVSSPNKKRISPPHRQQHEFGSSSLDGLRTGRKFILKAVPSFPPLTPCLDSKSVGTQQKDDAQNCRGNK